MKTVYGTSTYDEKKANAALLLNYDKNRGKSKKEVEKLTHDMVNGEFLPHSPIIYVDFNGIIILVDGQHRMFAVSETGKRKPEFKIRMPKVTYKAKTISDVEKVFSIIDQGRPRRLLDYLKATGLSTKNFNGTTLGKISAALAFLCMRIEFLHDGSKNPKSGPKVQNHIKDFEKEINQYLKIISKCKYDDLKKQLLKAPIFGVFLIALKYNNTKARKFILELTDAPNGSALGLRNWIAANNNIHGGSAQHGVAKAVSYYFNKYTIGESFTKKRSFKYFVKHSNKIEVVGFNI